MRIPDNYAKLLVAGVSDPYYLAYRLGRFGIYLQTFRPIDVEPAQMRPVLATVRYSREVDLFGFIREFGTEARVWRVFKHGKYFRKDNVNMQRNFLFRAAENLLGLVKGKTVRLKCKDADLRTTFFKILEEANLKGKFGCKFDYDRYDLEVELRSYEAKGHLWLVVTCTDLSKFTGN